jgi:hypothetical protein
LPVPYSAAVVLLAALPGDPAYGPPAGGGSWFGCGDDSTPAPGGGKAARRGVKVPSDQVERRRRTAREPGLRPDPSHVNGRPWTQEGLALLGKLSEDEVARRTGRTRDAVRQRRNLLKIPTAKDHRFGHAWRR